MQGKQGIIFGKGWTLGGRRITPDQQREIFNRRTNGESINDIASSMGISNYAVWCYSKDAIPKKIIRQPSAPPHESGEEWAEVSGYDGKYLISSHGRVFSTGITGRKAGLVTVRPTKHGYDYVVLSNNTAQRLPIHRLVAEHFCEGHDEGHDEVRHVDGNLKNNCADNLEWCAFGDQSAHIKWRQDGKSTDVDEDTARKAAVMYHWGATVSTIAKTLSITHEMAKEATEGVERFSDAFLYSEPGEEWKVVDGFGGKYQVSSYGRVFSTGGRTRRGGLIHISTAKNGYQSVSLSEGSIENGVNSRNSVPLHRLVATYFCDGHDDVNDVVNHIDGNPSNNHADNLEWCTQSYNIRHAIDVLGRNIGGTRSDETRRKISEALIGRRGHSCRFTDDEVRAIREDPRSAHQVAKQYGVNKSTILSIRSRKTYAYVD